MHAVIEECQTRQTPENLAETARAFPGLVLLRSGFFASPQARYSFVTANPFLVFKSWGSRCELESAGGTEIHYGDPWRLLHELMNRYESLESPGLPFPLGGCFGFWGYELKNFSEPTLQRRAERTLELPDCQVGFYGSLVVFDHRENVCRIIGTGLNVDGSRSPARARERVAFWRSLLSQPVDASPELPAAPSIAVPWSSNLSRDEFVARVQRAQDYIRRGHIYQVNLSHVLTAPWDRSGWELFQALSQVAPSPFGAYLDCGGFQLASSSPELFLRMRDSQIETRPIKGTRARSSEPRVDQALARELQGSPKERAELIMITDLLRNDLGKVCEYGTVNVRELLALEPYSHVQHLVSSIEGKLRDGTSHFEAFASCFPGGSVTGAPKYRAMEIIDELEPCSRGPYTGALGYLGFNRESQLSIVIRTAVCNPPSVRFAVGAGIVADSDPEAEYEETLAKAQGFLEAITRTRQAAAFCPDCH